MSKYSDYLDEIESRKKQGLSPKPIDSDVLLNEIIEQVKDSANPCREDSLNFLIFSFRQKVVHQSSLKNGRNLPPNQTNTIGSIISLLLQLGPLKIGAWEMECS